MLSCRGCLLCCLTSCQRLPWPTPSLRTFVLTSGALRHGISAGDRRCCRPSTLNRETLCSKHCVRRARLRSTLCRCNAHILLWQRTRALSSSTFTLHLMSVAHPFGWFRMLELSSHLLTLTLVLLLDLLMFMTGTSLSKYKPSPLSSMYSRNSFPCGKCDGSVMPTFRQRLAACFRFLLCISSTPSSHFGRHYSGTVACRC